MRRVERRGRTRHRLGSRENLIRRVNELLHIFLVTCSFRVLVFQHLASTTLGEHDGGSDRLLMAYVHLETRISMDRHRHACVARDACDTEFEPLRRLQKTEIGTDQMMTWLVPPEAAKRESLDCI
jgi:hypothetical protein